MKALEKSDELEYSPNKEKDYEVKTHTRNRNSVFIEENQKGVWQHAAKNWSVFHP